MLIFTKKLTAAMACIFLVSLTGCGNTVDSQKQVSQSSEDIPISSSNDGITIKQLPYTVKATINGGSRAMMMNFTNNTKFDLTQIKLHYNLKKDVTDNQLKKIFPEDADISDIKENGLQCYADSFIAKGKSIQVTCTADSELLTTEKQFNVAEPDTLAIEYINPDSNTLQTVYFDYITNEMIDDAENKPMDTWPVGSPRAALIPQPASTWITDLIDDADIGLSFTVLGATQSDYQQYLNDCINVGWQAESNWGSSYDFTEKDGYTLTVYYYSSSNTMQVDLDSVD